MGIISACCNGDNAETEAKQENKAKSETLASTTGETVLHIAFNEICLSNTEFQCTFVTTKSSKTECQIIASENMKVEDLYNAGDRLSDVSKLTADGEFYALIHRWKKGEIDESEIQKYKIIKTENKIDIKFVESLFVVFKDKNINLEGIEVIESYDNKLIGFLLCNDYFARPPNSHLYFLSLTGEEKLIYSFDDNGDLENDAVIEYNYNKEFEKNGYLILPQFLGLRKKAIFKDRNIEKFVKWSLENNEDAFMYFVNKKDILQLIEYDNIVHDEDEKKENNTKMEKVTVILSDNYKSDESVFVKYKDCENEGFEAISIDGNNNVLLTLEYAKQDDAFNCIVAGKIIANNEGDFQLIIDPCQYVKVDNNGGGKNHAQEALLCIK